MLPSLEHLDGTDIEHGERIRAVQRLDELRPLIANQEKEYRRGMEYKLVIYQLSKLIAKFFIFDDIPIPMNHVSQFLCIYLPSTVRERQKAEMAKEIAEGRSEYEREDTDADENRRAFWASKSKHTPGKFPFAFLVLTCSKYFNALTLL